MENKPNNINDDEITIDLHEVFGLLLNKAWLIAICAAAFAVIGFVVSFFIITPKYESTTSVYILSKKENTQLTLSDTQLATQLTKDYESLITSRSVLEQVINAFGFKHKTYEQLKSAVKVANENGTRIITITVSDSNPERARNLANEIRDVAATKIKGVMDIEAVNVVDTANFPVKQSEPSVPKWTVIFGFVGVLISAAVVIIRYMVDDTIKSSEDIEKYLGLSTLALIPDSNAEEGKKVKKKKKKTRYHSYENSSDFNDDISDKSKQDIMDILVEKEISHLDN